MRYRYKKKKKKEKKETSRVYSDILQLCKKNVKKYYNEHIKNRQLRYTYD